MPAVGRMDHHAAFGAVILTFCRRVRFQPYFVRRVQIDRLGTGTGRSCADMIVVDELIAEVL